MAIEATHVDRSASAHLFERARMLMPGGVSSPIRAFDRVGGNPFFVDRAEGAILYDVDGCAYFDYVMSWGALMLGHAHASVTRALTEATVRGTSYGAPTGAEVELADLVLELMPQMDMVRFVNSGTEATMSAVRLARAATGRDLILRFNGCYHGHADSFLVQPGSDVPMPGLPASPGVPGALAGLALSIPFNDDAAVRAAFETHGDRIACVIVEPVVGNAGFIAPHADFHAHLREITTMHGALLIFDEVMTGFRVALGGAAELFGVSPDLTVLGKVIGGGLPVGAFGGRRDLMEMIAPSGPVYQAGALSGNPLAMAAGVAQLLFLRETRPYDVLEQRARGLLAGLAATAHELGLPFRGDAAGAMFGWHFVDGPVHDFAAAARTDHELFARFHRASLDRGVFLPASPFAPVFMSIAHSQELVDDTLERLSDALREVVQ